MAQVERGGAGDLDEVVGLLERVHLPIEGLRDRADTLFVVREANHVIASSALEVYGDGVLLRSVAVDPAQRNLAIGGALVDAAIAFGESISAPAVYLLTTTAEDFFLRFGFARIERSDVPADIRNSVEFTSACPASATVMRRVLR